MNALTMPRNKLEAAYDLIKDATNELDGALSLVEAAEEHGIIATLSWMRGDLRKVLADLADRMEGEE